MEFLVLKHLVLGVTLWIWVPFYHLLLSLLGIACSNDYMILQAIELRDSRNDSADGFLFPFIPRFRKVRRLFYWKKHFELPFVQLLMYKTEVSSPFVRLHTI